MNGPEHYAEAERLLAAMVIRPDDQDYAADRPSICDFHASDCEGNGNLAAAQVHATLALVAAIASTRMTDFQSLIERNHTDVTDDPDATTWADVIRSTIGAPS